MAEISAVFVPELWAAQGISVLKKNLVMAELVHRDFENVVASRGDTINTRKPSKLTVRDWAGQEDTGELADNEIVVERPTAVNVPVVLNNHKYVSFMEEDKTGSLSITNIREAYIEPAIIPLAEAIDDTIMTEMVTGTDGDSNAIAEVQLAGADLAFEDIVELMKSLNESECPQGSRRLVMGTEHHAQALKDSLFVQADQSGSTSALREAQVGRAFGFDTFMSQNVPVNTDGPQSLGFHRDALAYVSRPLRPIPSQLGAQTSSQSDQGYTARVITSYKHRGLGIDVSFDLLWGVKLLDANLAKRLMG
jgi:hypothetical protein